MWRYQRVIHTLLNYLYSHIVYSIFYCKFEVLQRCSQPNTTMIMKTKIQIFLIRVYPPVTLFIVSIIALFILSALLGTIEKFTTDLPIQYQ